MPSDGPLRKLVGWIAAGVSRCAGAGGDGRRRPFPTALVLAGGAPLGCLAALFRKLGRRHSVESCVILRARFRQVFRGFRHCEPIE